MAMHERFSTRSERHSAKLKNRNTTKSRQVAPRRRLGGAYKVDPVLGKLSGVFRKYGYDAASLSLLLRASGLKKGSLYHRFPEGKAQMVQEVIESRGRWLYESVFSPLRDNRPPETRVVEMLKFLNKHYEGGLAACLLGVLALSENSKLYADLLKTIFIEWVDALATPLIDAGVQKDQALKLSRLSVAKIQGALVLTRILGSHKAFAQTLDSTQAELVDAIRAA